MLPSHKNQIHYLEHTKIVKIDERIAYTKDVKAKEFYFAIPYANTSVILLGPGTSITQSAMHHLASEGVMIAFTGGDGFPIFAGSLSEYRPTEYCQKWLSNWQNYEWRLKTAKQFQTKRVTLVNEIWGKIIDKFSEIEYQVNEAGKKFIEGLAISQTKENILGYEANYAKSLYRILSEHYNIQFKRLPQSKYNRVNELIDSHNYYAYGIASGSLWVLGIPHAFPVLHGDTRRGALVFDVADIIKDSFLLPVAFRSAYNNIEKENHKKECLKILNLAQTMTILFDEIKKAL
jgi:CRISPR-associated protein Cas1